LIYKEHFFIPVIEYDMLIKVLGRLFAIGFGLIILFVSMTRAGLSLMAQDGGLDSLKKDEVKFAEGTYKLPQPGMLPDHVFYGIKRIRDYLWIVLSHGNDKVKVSLLIADKKIVEFEKLTEKGQREMAIESGNEAIDKLKYANELVRDEKVVDAQSKQLRMQILWAGLAYDEVFRRNEEQYKIENEKFTKLTTRIDDWNREQEKNRYTWNY
jgi:hypothetical protein